MNFDGAVNYLQLLPSHNFSRFTFILSISHNSGHTIHFEYLIQLIGYVPYICVVEWIDT